MNYQVKAIDYNSNGDGVGKIDDIVVFIPYLMIGETARIRIVERKKTFWRGEIVELVTTSPNRGKSPCHLFKQCGGCHLLHMNYQGQLEFKKRIVENAFKNIAKTDIQIADPIPAEPLYYRNKAIVPVGFNDDKVVSGYYALQSNRIIPNRKCHLIPPEFVDIINAVVDIINNLKISTYQNGSGVIRHIFLRQGDKIALTLIVTSFYFKGRDALIEKIKKIPTIAYLSLMKNDADTNVILGKQEEVIFGTTITGTIFDINFNLSTKSFFQVNSKQTEKLYQAAIDMANFDGSEVVLDAYSGIGTIALTIAPRVKKVIAVEIIADAVKDGMETAKKYQLDNVDFITGDVKNIDLPDVDVTIIDPPRKGCDIDFLNMLIDKQPKKIIYISCNVATMARDVAELSKNYRLKKVIPVDMFPQTYNIEAVGLLEKVDNQKNDDK